MPHHEYSDLEYIEPVNGSDGILLNVENNETTFPFNNNLKIYENEDRKLEENGLDPQKEAEKKSLYSGQGPQPGDVVQTNDGICYFMSVLRNMAAMNPDAIKNLVTEETRMENGKPVKTGYAVVHFFAENEAGEKKPYDVRVPMLHSTVEQYSNESSDARWATVVQKAYFLSMLWLTDGKLPTQKEFKKFFGEGKQPVLPQWFKFYFGHDEFKRGSDPAIFIKNIVPEKTDNTAASGKTYNDMLATGNTESAAAMLSEQLMQAKAQKDIIVITTASHAISVENIRREKDGKVYLTYFDQLNQFTRKISVEDLLTKKIPAMDNDHDPLLSMIIYHKNEAEHSVSHQNIRLGTLKADLDKKDPMLDAEKQMKQFIREFEKKLQLEDLLYNTNRNDYTPVHDFLTKNAKELMEKLREQKLISPECRTSEFKERLSHNTNAWFEMAGKYYADGIINNFYSKSDILNIFAPYKKLAADPNTFRNAVTAGVSAAEDLKNMKEEKTAMLSSSCSKWDQDIRKDAETLKNYFTQLSETTFRDSRKFGYLQDDLENASDFCSSITEAGKTLKQNADVPQMLDFAKKQKEYLDRLTKLAETNKTYLSYKKNNMKTGFLRSGLGKKRYESSKALDEKLSSMIRAQKERIDDIKEKLESYHYTKEITIANRCRLSEQMKAEYENKSFQSLEGKPFNRRRYAEWRACSLLDNSKDNRKNSYNLNDLRVTALKISEDKVCRAMEQIFKSGYAENKVVSREGLILAENAAAGLVEDLDRYSTMSENELLLAYNACGADKTAPNPYIHAADLIRISMLNNRISEKLRNNRITENARNGSGPAL